jgi:hypothetical protein
MLSIFDARREEIYRRRSDPPTCVDDFVSARRHTV